MVFFVVCELRNGKRAAASFWISQPFFSVWRKPPSHLFARRTLFFRPALSLVVVLLFYNLQTCIVWSLYNRMHCAHTKKECSDPVQYSWATENHFEKQMAISLKTTMCEPHRQSWCAHSRVQEITQRQINELTLLHTHQCAFNWKNEKFSECFRFGLLCFVCNECKPMLNAKMTFRFAPFYRQPSHCASKTFSQQKQINDGKREKEGARPCSESMCAAGPQRNQPIQYATHNFVYTTCV